MRFNHEPCFGVNTNSNLLGTVERYFLVFSEEWTLRLSSTRRILSPFGYLAYGKTLEKRLFASDKKPRYVHLYHSTDLEAHERGEVEKKINQLTTFLNGNINKFREFGPGMETYFELYYDENAKRKEKKGEPDKQEQTARKFVFFEE